MTAETADFIVIGSGPAGVSAAIPPVAAGRRVIMLDAAGEAAPEPQLRWQRMLGADLQSLCADDGLSPKLRAPMTRNIVQPFQRDGGLVAENFAMIAAHGRGGLSTVWGAHLCRLDAEDFAGWPIGLPELQPSYDAVLRRIGASETGGETTREGIWDPALPLGATAAALLQRHRRSVAGSVGLRLRPAQNAILSRDRAGRLGCDLRGDCLYGCPRGAIYAATHDLAALKTAPGFRLVDHARVVRLHPGKDGGWEAEAADGRRFAAPRVLLAAGALGTLALVAPLLPQPAEGWRLLSSPVLAMPLLSPGRIGRRPTATHSLAQLAFDRRYGPGRRDYVTGAVYEIASLPASSFVNRMPLGRAAGRAAMALLGPAMLVATAYFPGDCSDNRLTLEPSGGGRPPQLKIRGGYADGFLDRLPEVQRALQRDWWRLGLVPLPGTALAPPGTDVHFGGTLPMGAAGPLGSSELGELNAAPGLHAVDGSVLPDLPSKFLTLTVMANADRIGHRLASTT